MNILKERETRPFKIKTGFAESCLGGLAVSWFPHHSTSELWKQITPSLQETPPSHFFLFGAEPEGRKGLERSGGAFQRCWNSSVSPQPWLKCASFSNPTFPSWDEGHQAGIEPAWQCWATEIQDKFHLSQWERLLQMELVIPLGLFSSQNKSCSCWELWRCSELKFEPSLELFSLCLIRNCDLTQFDLIQSPNLWKAKIAIKEQSSSYRTRLDIHLCREIWFFFPVLNTDTPHKSAGTVCVYIFISHRWMPSSLFQWQKEKQRQLVQTPKEAIPFPRNKDISRKLSRK